MWVYSVRPWESFFFAINQNWFSVMMGVLLERVVFAPCRCGGSVCQSGGTSPAVSVWQRFPLSPILCSLARRALQAHPGIQVPEDRLPPSLHPGSKDSSSPALCVRSQLRGEVHTSALWHVGPSHSSHFGTSWVGEALSGILKLFISLTFLWNQGGCKYPGWCCLDPLVLRMCFQYISICGSGLVPRSPASLSRTVLWTEEGNLLELFECVFPLRTRKISWYNCNMNLWVKTCSYLSMYFRKGEILL